VCINPRRPSDRKEHCAESLFPLPSFSFWCDSKPSLAFSHSRASRLPIPSPLSWPAVPTCAQSSFLASLSSACSGVEHLSQQRESCDLHSYLLSYLENQSKLDLGISLLASLLDLNPIELTSTSDSYLCANTGEKSWSEVTAGLGYETCYRIGMIDTQAYEHNTTRLPNGRGKRRGNLIVATATRLRSNRGRRRTVFRFSCFRF